MSTQANHIFVERGIEIDGITYGCVMKDADAEHWSFIPVGRYTLRAFGLTCDLFDEHREDVTEQYVVAEGASHGGETVTRLATDDESVAELARITGEFFSRNPLGYQPPTSIE